MLSQVECTIVGMCLNQPSFLEEFLDCGAKPQDFEDESLRDIFSAMIAADSANEPFDMVALLQRLKGSHFAKKLADCSEMGSYTQNPSYYAKELRSESYRRKVVAMGKELYDLGSNAELSVEDISSRIQKKVEDLEDPSDTLGKYSTPDDCMAFVERIDDIQKNGKPDNVSTGFPAVDQLTQGFKAGSLYVIGARTGVGKSEILCNFAFNTASLKYPTAYFSFEMHKDEILARIVSRMAKVNDAVFMNGLASGNELDRIAEAVRTVGTLPIHIVDDIKPEWCGLKRLIRTLKRRNGIRVVFIDYVQLLNSVGFRASERVRELCYISAQAKQLAAELKIAIVFAAQINRAGAQENEEPQLHHLKESGSLEQDANVVMLLHRIDAVDKGMIDLNIKKNRHGPERKIGLYFDYANHNVTCRS